MYGDVLQNVSIVVSSDVACNADEGDGLVGDDDDSSSGGERVTG
jgi:hypothetical protein